jgi:hypothetical protein
MKDGRFVFFIGFDEFPIDLDLEVHFPDRIVVRACECFERGS